MTTNMITGSGTLVGTNSDDIITGTGGFNDFEPRAGDDVLNGGSGIDFFDASQGDDIIFGNDGGDMLTIATFITSIFDAETFFYNVNF